MCPLQLFVLFCILGSTFGATERHGYVTALFSEDYKIAVEVLGLSLRSTGTTKDMIVIVSPNICEATKEELMDFGWKIKEVDELSINYRTKAKWQKNLTKLRLWQMTEYQKLVYLDADMLVLQNVDNLFNCPAPICAALDAPVPIKFNAGLLVISPNVTTFEALMDKWNEGREYKDVEQGLLNDFFPLSSLSSANILPFQYNAHTYSTGRGISHDVNDIKVLHYTTFKPWMWYTLPVGDMGYVWKQFAKNLPDSAASHVISGVLLLVIPWVILYLVNFIAGCYCKKMSRRRTIGFLAIWKLVLALLCSSFFGYVGFILIPSSMPYMLGWIIFYEWGFAGFWLPLVAEFQSSITLGQLSPDLPLPSIINFLEKYGEVLGHWKKGLLYFFALPLAIIFGGIYIVIQINSTHIVHRMVIFVITFIVAVVLNVAMAFIGPYLAFCKGRESRYKQQSVEIFV